MILRRIRSSPAARKIAFNTLMLSILSFSGYFLALVTLPYQARIFGPELFGQVSFAMAFGLYFLLFIDFGFTISATEQVSRHRNDKNELSGILSAVSWSKLYLAGISALVIILLCLLVEPFKSNVVLYLLFYLSYTFMAFIPDYMYRGMENMKAMTLRTVIIRVISVMLIFVFLKEPDDYLVVPLLLMLGNLTALLFVIWDMHHKGITIAWLPFGNIKATIKHSSMFFYSRVATNVFTTTNTFILGLVFGPATAVVGYFTSADKLTSAAKFSISPLIDSIYPHMISNKDFNLIKKILIFSMPIIISSSIFVYLFAYDISAFIFGAEFRPAGEYLRLLIPIAVIAFPSMLFGYPVLSPWGLSKYANTSSIFGSIIHVIQIGALFITGNLSVVSICVATIITELTILIFRLTVAWRYRNIIVQRPAD